MFAIGQRWISETEPELGLGSVSALGERDVEIRFPGSEDVRRYAQDSAPLRRVLFQIGDTIEAEDGIKIVVEDIETVDGCLVYHGNDQRLPEADLSHDLTFDEPLVRLQHQQFETPHAFALREDSLAKRHEIRSSPLRGFTGGRIDLIGHQFYIAREVTSRNAPRVLLADEVGLGKTIEAGLIIHRLLLSGRAARALILVPDSLVHQWFVEMMRRFNLWFSIYDQERCGAIEAGPEPVNPFLDEQLVLAGLSLFTQHPKRIEEAAEAGWDLVVVDEAHHLGWSEDLISPEYRAVETIGRSSPGLLLLTATPEQLGQESHFARLRLLDPNRYYSLDVFRREAQEYEAVAKSAAALLADSAVPESDRKQALDELIDQHGTGRVMYRNTRAAIKGFPDRKLHLHPLVTKTPAQAQACSAEFAFETAASEQAPDYEFGTDVRALWLVEFLREIGDEKVLLICRSRRKVLALEAALRARLNAKVAIFHEELTLITRDRNAAWFSEQDGASVLLCSEIGSEGRNFQFAHHLVLFDLPDDPELLEQRIGRLDRIGQTEEIAIHVPYVPHTPEDILRQYYHEGLDAIEHNLHGIHEAHEHFLPQIHDWCQTPDQARPGLLSEIAAYRRNLIKRLEQGRDRLLELNSYRPEVAHEITEQIADRDFSTEVDIFTLRLLDFFGFTVEDMSNRTYMIRAERLFSDSLPSVPEEGLLGTFERRRALSREDLAFLSWDHPLVLGLLDAMLSGHHGNVVFAISASTEHRELVLDVRFVVECIAPPSLHVDRFLPPTPISISVDNRMTVQEPREWPALATVSPESALLQNQAILQALAPKMLATAEEEAETRMARIVDEASRDAGTTLGHELERLLSLRKVNDSVRSDEIELARQNLASTAERLSQARLRVDSLRLIWHGPEA